VPFWLVIVVVLAAVGAVIVVSVTSASTSNQSAPCSKFASAATVFEKSVQSTKAGTTTTEQLTAVVAALPAELKQASSAASGDVAQAMSESVAAATSYVTHRSDFAATTKLFDSFTAVQHYCEVAGSPITIG
jgi:hypothetical protein